MLEFKNYIGTKKLKATPMNKEEYCQYRNWIVPENEVPTEDGYLVEYQDGGKPNDERHEGYISWSPKDVFEKSYIEIVEESFLDRVIKEEYELGVKITALSNFLNKDYVNKITGDLQFSYLNLQRSAMIAYRQILIIRIEDLKSKEESKEQK
jgi:hypothetical protein